MLKDRGSRKFVISGPLRKAGKIRVEELIVVGNSHIAALFEEVAVSGDS
jgi:hypothetical protein